MISQRPSFPLVRCARTFFLSANPRFTLKELLLPSQTAISLSDISPSRDETEGEKETASMKYEGRRGKIVRGGGGVVINQKMRSTSRLMTRINLFPVQWQSSESLQSLSRVPPDPDIHCHQTRIYDASQPHDNIQQLHNLIFFLPVPDISSLDIHSR